MPVGVSAATIAAMSRRIDELEHEAAVGESDKTPGIVFANVWVVCAIGVLVALGLALAAYRNASM
jgi:hypothetical protein